MKVQDVLVGLFFIVIGILMIGHAAELKPPRHLKFGPGFFPLLIGSGLIIVGGVIALLGLRSLRTEPLWHRPEWSRTRQGWVRFCSIPAAIALYVLIVDAAGFLLTAVLVMVLVLAVSGVPLRRSVPAGAVTAVVLTAIFASVLHVPLPWGPLQNISGWLLW
ncbi:tripartite tricarboxylate transporter TctB family protein [Azospirillum brasilense]|nr:tripartite tricarboxylate transporter TctB family protein [Azospirillum brasilense]TWA85317.1 tripartite tricarboxylate transporter TctB family protein [Azospirillum brasilense]